MADPELVLRFPDHAALLDEYAKNLAYGRAFVAGVCELAPFSLCTLLLQRPELAAQLSIACRVVALLDDSTENGPGLGLQFCERDPASLERLRAFVFETEEPETAPAESPASQDDLPEEQAHDPADAQRAVVEARAARLRNLTPAQRMQVARGSVPDERVLLERIYGSAVWELLLRNPKITVPEVARMARKGTMPRPLLDLIAENEQWVRHSLIRRALLGNPRLSADAINRVLRTLPPRELKLVPQQTAYPPSVRQAATRLMRGS
jgi:hypothetical protein